MEIECLGRSYRPVFYFSYIYIYIYIYIYTYIYIYIYTYIYIYIYTYIYIYKDIIRGSFSIKITSGLCSQADASLSLSRISSTETVLKFESCRKTTDSDSSNEKLINVLNEK